MGWVLGFGIPAIYIFGWLFTARLWSDRMYKNDSYFDSDDVVMALILNAFAWPIGLIAVLCLNLAGRKTGDWTDWFLPTRQQHKSNREEQKRLHSEAVSLDRLAIEVRRDSPDVYDGLKLAAQSMREQANSLKVSRR